jgi:hypothetical protein
MNARPKVGQITYGERGCTAQASEGMMHAAEGPDLREQADAADIHCGFDDP